TEDEVAGRTGDFGERAEVRVPGRHADHGRRTGFGDITARQGRSRSGANANVLPRQGATLTRAGGRYRKGELRRTDGSQRIGCSAVGSAVDIAATTPSRFSDQDRGGSATGIKRETTRSVQDNGSR